MTQRFVSYLIIIIKGVVKLKVFLLQNVPNLVTFIVMAASHFYTADTY